MCGVMGYTAHFDIPVKRAPGMSCEEGCYVCHCRVSEKKWMVWWDTQHIVICMRIPGKRAPELSTTTECAERNRMRSCWVGEGGDGREWVWMGLSDMHVCVCVCVCIYIYVWMYICGSVTLPSGLRGIEWGALVRRACAGERGAEEEGTEVGFEWGLKIYFYVCMYVCVYVCMYVCVNAHTRVYIYIYMHTCVWISKSGVRESQSMCAYVHVRSCNTQKYTHIHRQAYTSVRVCVYACVCVWADTWCVHIYIYI